MNARQQHDNQCLMLALLHRLLQNAELAGLERALAGIRLVFAPLSVALWSFRFESAQQGTITMEPSVE
jgi:hypothetical protein